jgi:quercetin dioxygenase-like cupin family protein
MDDFARGPEPHVRDNVSRKNENLAWEEDGVSTFMHAIRKEDLPYIGSSYNFVGANQGDVAVSIFFVEAHPGHGAPLHRHKYDEIIIVQDGHSRLVIGDLIKETQPGEIIVIKADTPHGFINIGSTVLKQIDIHLNSRFEQEAVDPTDVSRRAGLLQSA